jgi:hypothetical protein
MPAPVALHYNGDPTLTFHHEARHTQRRHARRPAHRRRTRPQDGPYCAIAPTLQAARDDWAFIAPQLAALHEDMNADGYDVRPISIRVCAWHRCRGLINASLARPIAGAPRMSRGWSSAAAMTCSVHSTASLWPTRNGGYRFWCGNRCGDGRRRYGRPTGRCHRAEAFAPGAVNRSRQAEWYRSS